MPYIYRGKADVKTCAVNDAHGGVGTIFVRQLLGFQEGADFPGDPNDFEAPVNFAHRLELPPGSSIGTHFHADTEEFYYVFEGDALMISEGKEIPMSSDSIFLIKRGTSHSFENNSEKPVTVFVVEFRLHEQESN